jgi:hypothetical protein
VGVRLKPRKKVRRDPPDETVVASGFANASQKPQLKFEGLKFVIALGPAPWPRFAGQNGPAFFWLVNVRYLDLKNSPMSTRNALASRWRVSRLTTYFPLSIR